MESIPPDRFATLADRLIHEAMEAGAFDDLAGAGKPLPGAGKPDDELWWVRAWMERNPGDRESPTEHG
jgi:hypothetical protein